jgi:plastocyanin
MRNRCSAVLSTALLGCALALAPATGNAAGASHTAEACPGMTMAAPVPVPGDPGAFRVQTPYGERVVRTPKFDAAVVPDYTITVTNFSFSVDTLRITQGQTVRWHLIVGTHTVTDGTGGLDINAGSIFDIGLSTLSFVNFDWTFTEPGVVPYFCRYHELFNNMRGVIVVQAPLDVAPSPVAARAGFSRPPQPNPSRDVVAFSIALAHDGDVALDVLDAMGRRVAAIQHGALPAGEHAMRWDGRTDAGRMAAPGVYRLHLQTPGVDETRMISLLR